MSWIVVDGRAEVGFPDVLALHGSERGLVLLVPFRPWLVLGGVVVPILVCGNVVQFPLCISVNLFFGWRSFCRFFVLSLLCFSFRLLRVVGDVFSVGGGFLRGHVLMILRLCVLRVLFLRVLFFARVLCGWLFFIVCCHGCAELAGVFCVGCQPSVHTVVGCRRFAWFLRCVCLGVCLFA